ncbi:Pentapeptide repeats (8 copies) [compost metagenome]
MFKDCDLREADFSGAMGNQYTWDEQEMMYYGMEGVDFGGSDLTGASFRGALLAGARFNGAVLKDTDFTGAILKDAVFAEEARYQTAWNERQLAEICWV